MSAALDYPPGGKQSPSSEIPRSPKAKMSFTDLRTVVDAQHPPLRKLKGIRAPNDIVASLSQGYTCLARCHGSMLLRAPVAEAQRLIP